MRRIAIGMATAVLAAALAVVLWCGLIEARSDPVVRRARIALPGWPAGARPVTVALLGDVHIGSRAMDAARLTRIVAQVNAQAPDLVVIAGDMVDGHDPALGAVYAGRLTVPLARLHAPLGVVGVLGNHDHWTAPGAVTAAMRHAGVTVLANAAVRRGPLAVIGVDDAYSGHADVAAAMRAAAGLGGAPVVVSHSPAVVGMLQRGRAPLVLVLVAHTHCGQVVLPVVGPLHRSLISGRDLYDPRYACGIVHEKARTVIVTGGLGTSVAPIRLGAPPDWWLLTLGA